MLVLTEVVSEWTECAPVVVKSRELIVETLERIRQSLPFPLISLDTDNGTEFVSELAVNYCAERGIGLTPVDADAARLNYAVKCRVAAPTSINIMSQSR